MWKHIQRLNVDQGITARDELPRIASQRSGIAAHDHHPIDLLRHRGLYDLRPAARARWIEYGSGER
jgi:hypothetical protein